MYGVIVVLRFEGESGLVDQAFFLAPNREWVTSSEAADRAEHPEALASWGFLPPSHQHEDILLIAGYNFSDKSVFPIPQVASKA